VKNFAIAASVIAIAVGLTMLQRVLATADEASVQTPRATARAQSHSVKGQVLSVESTSASNSSSRPRRAVVKLNSGETVEASVPNGCIVLPGQVARLGLADRGNPRTYVVQGTE
jgi:hypothetical protein